jgi:hypothetical protein
MSTLRAPTGDVERWLITDKDSGGVYGVGWDVYWFDLRARGAAFYVEGRVGQIEVNWHPPSAEEKASGKYLTGLELAEATGRDWRGREDLEVYPPSPPKRRVQCPEIYTFKNGTSSSFCTKDKNHEGKHKGWRKEWE